MAAVTKGQVPAPRDEARRDVSIAQLTAKADLVLEELGEVIATMARMLREGAEDGGT